MKKKRVGIIGCGKIFPMHAYSIQGLSQVEIVSVCDVDKVKAKTAATTFACRYYMNYEEMYEKEKLDSVHICTPHYLHPKMTLEAMKRGIHVLLEKPVAISLDEAYEISQGKNQYGVQVMVSFQNRFNPASIRIKEILESGILGPVLGARASLAWQRTDEYYQESSWKGTWEKEGGGVVIDQAIHTLDLMNWFIDLKVKSVIATLGNRGQARIEVEDYAEGVIIYENDVRASFHFMNYYTYDAPVELEITCEKGLIKLVGDEAIIDTFDGKLENIRRHPGERFFFGDAKQYWGVGHKKLITYFYECLVREEQIKKNDFNDVLITQEIVMSIYESGKNGRRVDY